VLSEIIFDNLQKRAERINEQQLKLSDEKRYYLDLGALKNMARVHLNGKKMGTLWTTPWRLDITDALKSKGNILEIEVVNLWPNRLIAMNNCPRMELKMVAGRSGFLKTKNGPLAVTHSQRTGTMIRTHHSWNQVSLGLS
jgi:hypothetical protein